jgi:hypothetical protein
MGRPSAGRELLNGKIRTRPVPVDFNIIVGSKRGYIIDGSQNVPIYPGVGAGNVYDAITVRYIRSILPKPKTCRLDGDVAVRELRRKGDGVSPRIGKLNLRAALDAYPARLKRATNVDGLSAGCAGERLIRRVVE